MCAPEPDPTGKSAQQLLDEARWAYGMRVAKPPTDDDRTVLAGMDRPATPEELIEFVACEQARIRREHGLPPED